MRLLLVDDQPANLLALDAILRDPEYELLTATSGEQALQIVLREHIAVILLDVVMPEMDGFEVAKHLKQVERTRDIPIVFLTALATDVQQIYRAYDVGAVDYLVKPLDAEVVRRKVRTFVEFVRQRDEIEWQARALREADQREHALQLAELRIASDRRYRKLIEGIRHAIGWTTDDQLKTTFISAQAPDLFGYPAERFLEPSFWSELVHPDDRAPTLAMFRRALGEGIELACEHRILTGDGRVAWLLTSVSGERATGETGAELHGISLDVTELEIAREEARRATRDREQLLAVVTHDLGSPLASIKLGADLVSKKAAAANLADLERTAQAISRSVTHMEHLIADLLDFARVQAGTLAVEREEVDLAPIVRETIEMFDPVAADKRLQLVGEVSDELHVLGDRVRLRQILSNLVGNAIKFTPGGGTIAVRAWRSDRNALIAVTDTGSGIAEAELPHVWDSYWQASRCAGGLGLGLPIAKGLIEAHGGTVWVESEVGTGTTIQFSIPLVQEVGRRQDATTAAAP